MSNFIVRVELYGTPAEGVYANLHTAMKTKGFSRTFTDNGKTYSLPHAMYLLPNSNSATVNVVDLAKQAASTVWKDFAVLVTRTEVRFEYFGLKLA